MIEANGNIRMTIW